MSTTTTRLNPLPRSRYALARSRYALARRLFALPALPRLREMLRAIATRRQLAEMDDRMLRDIGISHVDALREAERLPWDLARHPRG